MAKKNFRCPLQAECERSCKFHGRELDCDYYDNNARGDYVLEDQEERRAQREREWDEQFFENLLDEMDDEEDGGEDTRKGRPYGDGAEDGDHVASVGKMVMLPVDKIHPHPDNPRKDLGDLTELAESIKANGVLQNLTVVRGHRMSEEEWKEEVARYAKNSTEENRAQVNTKWLNTDYTVVIGHRRLAASKLAGLTEVPCVIVEMTPAEQFATMMVENVQRSDLTVYEQAQGFQTMLDMGGTVEEVARQTGFSRTTVRNRLKLMKLDQQKLKNKMSSGATLQDYIKLDEIQDDDRRNKVLDTIGTVNFHAELKKALATEAIERKVAQWETLVTPFAKQVKKRPEVATHTLVKQFTTDSGSENEAYEIPDDAVEVEYLYFVDKEYGVYLYKPRERDSDADQRDRERREAAERYKRKKAEFEEITDLHLSLREDFLAEFTPTKKEHKEAIERYVVNTLVHIQGKWARVDWVKVGELLNIEADSEGPDETEFADVLRYNPARALLTVTYSMDSYVTSWKYWQETYSSEGIIHRKNDRLDALYALLTTLGYELSDEELQMQKGTHELFYPDDE